MSATKDVLVTGNLNEISSQGSSLKRQNGLTGIEDFLSLGLTKKNSNEMERKNQLSDFNVGYSEHPSSHQ